MVRLNPTICGVYVNIENKNYTIDELIKLPRSEFDHLYGVYTEFLVTTHKEISTKYLNVVFQKIIIERKVNDLERHIKGLSLSE